MYKRNAQGWSKHFDFFILDEISLQIAFLLAVYLRHDSWAYSMPIYRELAFILIISDAFIIVSINTFHNVVTRGYFNELRETLKHGLIVFSIVAIYMFAMQSGDAYSRISLFLTFIMHVLFSFVLRILWKVILKSIGVGRKKSSLLLVTTPENADEIIEKLSSDELAGYRITGVVLTEETEAKEIGGYPIVARLDEAADYIVREWVDSVYINALSNDDRIRELMTACTIMGVPTHYRVKNMTGDGVKRFSEKMGDTTVLTTSINYVTPFQASIKRLFDIFVGVIGSFVAIIIIAIIGPIIKIKSPGPILFSQERIGRNGKRFHILKIRSMCIDAEERKKELLNQNIINDGMMFKMDFDPRIIGNEVMPDKSKKTGIGDFVRRTSLDEFPQFFMVLIGTMSIVGTRPPTIDEYQKYDYHHRARMAIKPGMTGLWQVNGRSNITDFEEIVRLDTEYITNWSLALDLKILLKTVFVIFTGKGAM